MKRLPSLIAVLCALMVSTAPAQEETAETRGQALLESLTEIDESLLGTMKFGIYLEGQKNLGTVVFETNKAGEDSSAAYQVVSTGNMAMGPTTMSMEEICELGTAFQLVSRSQTETEAQGEESQTKKEMLVTSEGSWVMTRTAPDGTETSQTVAVDGHNHGSLPGMLLLVQKLDLSKATTYQLQEAKFPEADGEEGDAEEARHHPMTITVAEQAPYAFRGTEVPAQIVTVTRHGEGESAFVIDGEKNVIAFWPGDAPIQLISGTDEEITQDIGEPKEVAEGSGTPLGAVKVYFEVIAKTKPTSALDDVMDWEAIKAELGADNPQVAGMDTAALALIMKGQFEKQPAAITQDQITMLMSVLKEEVEGDTATVAVPNEEDKFKLKKFESGWKIQHFPH